MHILEVKRVTQCFGQLAAVSDLSFEVERGEVFGIAGPNGAGKSTLFNMITGYYRYSGEILLDNVKISGLRPHQVCHNGIARTFQVPELFLTLTVFENLKIAAHFGSPLHGARDEERVIKGVIELLGLLGKEKVITTNLGLYDKKLTMMGVALATRPKLLLVDEPTAGLSPTEIKQSMDLIQKVNKGSGLTIIIIEHLMKVLTTLCQRLLIMESGQRIALGPPEEVCRNEKVIEIYLGKEKHA